MAFGLDTTLSIFARFSRTCALVLQVFWFTRYCVCNPLLKFRSVVLEREHSYMLANTRTSYQRLGLDMTNFLEYLPFLHTKPKMLDNSADSMKRMVEEALARKQEDMISF